MVTDKIAVVTGASRGIGRQIAKTLAAKGATVIVNYNGSAAKAEEVVKEIEEAGGKAEAVQCNVSEFAKAGELMDYVVKKYGRVDILVNNAGITRDNLLMKMSEEDFDAVINTNLKGAFNCIKHDLPTDVKAEERTDRQYLLRFRRDGQRGPGQLQRVQGRCDRHDQGGSQRAGKQRHHLQRGGARLYRDGDDRRSGRQRKRGCDRPDPHEEIRRDQGCGQSGSVPGVR